MTIRLIASDLDGTLFGPDSVPEARTVAAVNAAVDTGLVFVAVTGRSYFGGAERVTGVGIRAHWFIGSNGGHRLNLTSGELEERLLFSAHEVDGLQQRLADELSGIGFACEHDEGFTYDTNFVDRFPMSFDGGRRVDTARWANNNIGKIFITHPDLTTDELIAATAPLAPEGAHVTTSGTTFVEMTPAGADKALALARLCSKLNIDADQVVAFGDNNNDISMLQWAGRGIAMANATDQAQAAANEITMTNLEFGVAQVIESLLV